jgi:hypothetical protein
MGIGGRDGASGSELLAQTLQQRNRPNRRDLPGNQESAVSRTTKKQGASDKATDIQTNACSNR